MEPGSSLGVGEELGTGFLLGGHGNVLEPDSMRVAQYCAWTRGHRTVHSEKGKVAHFMSCAFYPSGKQLGVCQMSCRYSFLVFVLR